MRASIYAGRMPFVIVFVGFLLAMTGCAWQDRPPVQHSSIDFPSLMANGELEAVADLDVLALDAPMRELLDRHVALYPDPAERLAALQRLFSDPARMRLKYDRDRTGTAAETFAAGGGDCVSFANLTVAMARYVGLQAHYQDALVRSNWDRQGDFAVLKRHMNVLVGGGGQYRIYDFFAPEPRADDIATLISDEQARAQYFNNRGIAYFRIGEPELALRHLKRALLLDPRQAFILSNIGTVYSNNGQYAVAERFLLRALRLDHGHRPAMVNLAELYWKQGRAAQAQRYERLVEPYRLQNPYYRYLLAQEAYDHGDYREAVNQLQRAASIKPERDFYLLMAEAYGKQGNVAAAGRSYRRAQELLRAGQGQAQAKSCCGAEQVASY